MSIETRNLSPIEIATTIQRSAVLSHLRTETSLSFEETKLVAEDARTQGFLTTKKLLGEEGINIFRLDHPARPKLTNKVDNLTHGFTLPFSKIGVTGLCLPERFTFQSLLPLLVIQDLLENNLLETAYIAVPLMAYAGAGLKRDFQYRQTIGIAQELFGERWGSQVFVLPDHLLANPKTKLGYLTARHLTKRLAEIKYPFPNLFSAWETVGYATDAVLVALAEQQEVTTILDFRQFESIHGHITAAKALGINVGSLILTVLDPQINEKGGVTDITWENPSKPIGDHRLPEISGLFLHALALFRKEDISQLYKIWKNTDDHPEIRELVEAQKNHLTHSRHILKSQPETIETLSLERLQSSGVFECVNSLIINQTKYEDFSVWKNH